MLPQCRVPQQATPHLRAMPPARERVLEAGGTAPRTFSSAAAVGTRPVARVASRMRAAASQSAADLMRGPEPGPSHACRWLGSSCGRSVSAMPALLAARTVGSHRRVPAPQQTPVSLSHNKRQSVNRTAALLCRNKCQSACALPCRMRELQGTTCGACVCLTHARSAKTAMHRQRTICRVEWPHQKCASRTSMTARTLDGTSFSRWRPSQIEKLLHPLAAQVPEGPYTAGTH